MCIGNVVWSSCAGYGVIVLAGLCTAERKALHIMEFKSGSLPYLSSTDGCNPNGPIVVFEHKIALYPLTANTLCN